MLRDFHGISRCVYSGRTSAANLFPALLLVAVCVPCAAVRQATAQERATSDESEASPEAWNALRDEWTAEMLGRLAETDAATRSIAVEYLAANPPQDAAWDHYVRNKLRSDDLAEVAEGMELLSSTAIEFAERVELMQSALTTINDRYIHTNSSPAQIWRSLVVSRTHTAQTAAAVRIIDMAEAHLRGDAALRKALIEPMLAEDQPAPAVFNLLFRLSRDADIDVAKRLLELARGDDKPTAAMASLVMNAVLNAAPTAPARRTVSASEDDKYLQYAERIVERFDKDDSGDLTVDEWKVMQVDPSPADADGNGRISKQEFAKWIQAR